METEFASPERLPVPDWVRQVVAVADHPLVCILLDSVAGHLVILNSHRQVVAANAEFLSLLGHYTLDALPGKRLGELLACENATLTEGGCGTTEACSSCGAVLATLEVLERHVSSEKECHLCTVASGQHRAVEFRVKASPLTIGTEEYVVFVFQDISGDKRRANMERIFFHDLRNLLGGLTGAGELLSLTSKDQYAEAILRMSRLLNAEVEAQNLLAQAEAGEASVNLERIPLKALLNDVQELFSVHPCSRNRTFRIGRIDRHQIVSDRNVVFRILVNMVKNGYEASLPGQEVLVEVETQGAGTRFSVRSAPVMPPEVARRVFERCFSTKQEPGRGLGTYSMRLLAEQFLGAKVWFTSVEGQGTCFVLDVDAPEI